MSADGDSRGEHPAASPQLASPPRRELDAAMIAALTRIGVSETDAAELVDDDNVRSGLSDAYSVIRESRALADDASRCLAAALLSEGLSASDIAETLAAVDSESPVAVPRRRGTSGDDGIGAEDVDDDGEDFSRLIEQLIAHAAAADARRAPPGARSLTVSHHVDCTLLPVLPLVAQYCGARVALGPLAAACASWRGLLLSDSPSIQRTLWLAVAVEEFPVSVAELGDDAFVAVASWSDVLRGFLVSRRRA
jgi:hypothetical protein